MGGDGRRFARFLGGNKKLVLSYDWDEHDWLDPSVPRSGTLPGEGYTIYMLRASAIDVRDEWAEGESLQEFRYYGGGEARDTGVPAEVREACEGWYLKLSQESARAGLTIRFSGSLGTERDVDKLLGFIGTASPHLPITTSELDSGTTSGLIELHRATNSSRVKGFVIRMHEGGDQIPFAFLDRGNSWVITGLVKTQPREFPEDEAKTIWLLDSMIHHGVDLRATDDGNA